MNLWDRLSKRKETDLSKTQVMRPFPRDATGGLPANEKNLRGLKDGTLPELQFASPLAQAPINVPVSLVSIPTPTAEDEQTTEAVKELLLEHGDDFDDIERTKLLLGTAWRWCRYDAKEMKIVWESIPDGSITDIILDPISFRILAIYTDDMFNITTKENEKEYYQRKRIITPEKITVRWIGNKGSMDDASSTNPFGFMPIPFSHASGENEWRGRSALGCNLRSYKSYHDVKLNALTILAEFKPKLVHTVETPENWMANNGYSSIAHANGDVMKSQMFLNKTGETTDMIFLGSDALGSHASWLKNLKDDIISGSSVPEIFWGGLATGNHASTDTDKDLAIQYIKTLRQEDTKPYAALFNQSLEIKSYVEMKKFTEVTVNWGNFDMVSTDVKAGILQKVSSGIAQLVSSAGGTKEDALYFWKSFYPDLPEADVEAFSLGIKKMAEHKAYSSSDILSQIEGSGSE